jgi:2-keto-4-pentenoate hydratase/2-oxohepta-3-ene-1,7-dioic acid hydratase in catechol pathway
MRFASFRTAGFATWGVLSGDYLCDLGPSGSGIAPSLRSALAAGNLTSVDLESATRVPVSSVTWLPVIPDPAKIICVGVNYRLHQVETGRDAAKAPTLFVRFPDSQTSHESQIAIPSIVRDFDYEGELAVVVGKELYNTPASKAFDGIAGYGIYNDFTARDWQRAASQWTPGKNFPGTGAFGPYLITPDEVGRVDELELQTRVNGEVRQNASVGDLIFDIPALVAYITSFTRLSPGDVIVTGTPGGVGQFMQPPRLLNDGDVVEVSITGLGTLRNRIIADSPDRRAQAPVGASAVP